MSIIRVKKEEKYSVIKNDILNNEKLTWEARGVMAYLLSKPDGWECRNYDLVNQGPSGKHVIQRVMKELSSYGYVRRYRVSLNKQQNGRGKIEWVTEIYEDPQLNTDYRNTNISTIDNSEGRSFEVEKPGHIVSTDSQKVLTSKNTDLSPNSEDDFSDILKPSESEQPEEIQSPNGQTPKQPLTEAEIIHMQTFGVMPEKKPLTYDIRQEMDKAGWRITIDEIEKATALYILLVRELRPGFAVPNNVSVRKDWHKEIQGHLQDYALNDLPRLYKAAITRLNDNKMTYIRPGSLTKILADVASEASSIVNYDTPSTVSTKY